MMARPQGALAKPRRVLFAQRRLPHYRIPLLEHSRVLLATHGIEFDFIYGEPTAAEALKADEGQLPWGQRMRATHYALAGRLCWQPFATRGYELVIVSQENRLLFNHWLCRPWRAFKLAFFSHGANLESTATNSLRERFKRWSTRQADWMFAYTTLSAELITRAGFPSERVTVMNNAVDTQLLRRQCAEVDEAQRAAMRQRYDLTEGKTGLFLGSLYAGKSLDTLVAAADRAHREEPRFRLLVVGDGPASAQVREAVATRPWMHWLGAQRGPDKARTMAISDMLLLPGAVGLSILDGFAAGLPLLTRDVIGHGPEIAYLSHGENGLRSAADAADFARELVALVHDPTRLAQLKAGAERSSLEYTIEAMARNFTGGISACLES